MVKIFSRKEEYSYKNLKDLYDLKKIEEEYKEKQDKTNKCIKKTNIKCFCVKCY